MAHSLFLGVDVGTSGCRAVAITAGGVVLARSSAPLPAPVQHGAAAEQDPEAWWQAVQQALQALFYSVPAKAVQAIAVDGTSGTVLLVDPTGRPLTRALLYNDSRSQAEAKTIAALAPPGSGALNATSGLAKLLYLQARPQASRAAHLLHQADWIAYCLGAPLGISDENNGLKTGYDPAQRGWPNWLNQLPIQGKLLPSVVPPGTAIGTVGRAGAERFGLRPQTTLVAGTTDSVAAFIATGASRPGEAVTSLGSTLALKVASEQPVFEPAYGVYSHRLGDLWLAGGASNSGGAVLKQYFTQAQLEAMTLRLQPAQPTGLDYYPLPRPGERFPINAPQHPARLTPRPPEDYRFFQGILEGVASIEKQGYERLHSLGAPFPHTVVTAGGGARNPAWTRIRAQALQVPVTEARETEAAYGSALLARQAGGSPNRLGSG